MNHIIRSFTLIVAAALAFGSARASQPPAAASCFILHDEQRDQTTRDPSATCSTRVTPASTFKIPHALAALDAGVVSGPEEVLRYDGSPQAFDVWGRDHDLRSAMRDSVLWFFQRIAERLGTERERAYLKAFDYGNQDASGPLTSFWLGSSLRISPDEQLTFLRRFFAGELRVREDAARAVRAILVQPAGRIVNARGAHAMAAPWPAGTTVFAKTGAGPDNGRRVVWLVGRVTRGERAWIFVSNVVSDDDPMAAVNLVGRRLTELRVLQ